MRSTLVHDDEKKYADRSGKDPLLTVARALAGRIRKLKPVNTTALLQALHDALDGPDEAARQARTTMQMHLVRVSDRLLAGESSAPNEGDRMLSTEQAARLMKCSRPYVAMLIDQGQLPGSEKSAGGHRKVPHSSVVAWIAAHTPRGTGDYRAAAEAAGMYKIPESVYVSVARTKKKRA